MSRLIRFPMTRRESEIQELDDEIVRLEKSVSPPDPDGRELFGKDAEMFFRYWTKSRHRHQLNRGGWPDFLVTSRKDGKVFGVEVKSSCDCLSRGQAKCFAVLEKAGLPVYVWQPTRPSILVPWRKWFKASRGFRAE